MRPIVRWVRTLRHPRSPRRDRRPKRHSPLKSLLLSAGMGFALLAGIGVIGDRISRAHNAVRASTPAPDDTASAGRRPSGDEDGTVAADRSRPTAAGEVGSRDESGGVRDPAGQSTATPRRAVARDTPGPRRTASARPAAVPSPDPGETRALLTALRRIDPALDHGRSIGRALNSCRDLANGMDRRRVTERTRLRFDGTAVIGVRQADRILTAIEDTFCLF